MYKDVNFKIFCSQLAIREIFIPKIVLEKLLFALIGVHDTLEWRCLTLTRDNGMLLH